MEVITCSLLKKSDLDGANFMWLEAVTSFYEPRVCMSVATHLEHLQPLNLHSIHAAALLVAIG